METERHVRLFRNGRNQAVRIPREFEMTGNEAVMRKEGNRLVIEPLEKQGLLEILQSLETLDDSFDDLDQGLGELDEVNFVS